MLNEQLKEMINELLYEQEMALYSGIERTDFKEAKEELFLFIDENVGE